MHGKRAMPLAMHLRLTAAAPRIGSIDDGDHTLLDTLALLNARPFTDPEHTPAVKVGYVMYDAIRLEAAP